MSRILRHVRLCPTGALARVRCAIAGVTATLSLDAGTTPRATLRVDDAKASKPWSRTIEADAGADLTLSWFADEAGGLVIGGFAGFRSLGRHVAPGALASGRAPLLLSLDVEGARVVDAFLGAELTEFGAPRREIDWRRRAVVLIARSPEDFDTAQQIARDLGIDDVLRALADADGRVVAAALGASDQQTDCDDAALAEMVERLSADAAGVVVHADIWRASGCLQRLRALLAAAPPPGGAAIHHLHGCRIVVAAASPIAALAPFTVERRRIVFDDALFSARPVDMVFEGEPDGDAAAVAARRAAAAAIRRTPVARAKDGGLICVGEPAALAELLLPVSRPPTVDDADPRRALHAVLSDAEAWRPGPHPVASALQLFEDLQRAGRFARMRIALQPVGGAGPGVEVDIHRAAMLHLADLNRSANGSSALPAALRRLQVSVEATSELVRFVVTAGDSENPSLQFARATCATQVVSSAALAHELSPLLALRRLRLIGADDYARPLPAHCVDWLEAAAVEAPEALAPLLNNILPRMLDVAVKPRVESVLRTMADALSGADLEALLDAAASVRLGHALGLSALMRLAMDGRISDHAASHLTDHLPIDEAETVLAAAAAAAARSAGAWPFNADAHAARRLRLWLRRPGKASVMPPWLRDALQAGGRLMQSAGLVLPLLFDEVPDPLANADGARSLDAEEAAALAGLMCAGRIEDASLRRHVTDRILGARPEAYAPLREEDRRYERVRDFVQPPTDPSEVVCLIVARNEAVRLPHVLRHHYSLGVRHFVLIDNMSDDGTVAAFDGYNARIYRTAERYSRSRWGVAWVNDVLSRDFADRWVLVIDADEMLVYPHCETTPIDRLVRWLDAAGYDGLETLMVDMYPAAPLEDVRLDDATDLRALYCWHDVGNYVFSIGVGAPILQATGGVRDRLFRFGANAALPPIALNKAPLVRWRHGRRFLTSTHTVTPLRLPPFLGVLEHYKYLPDFAARARRETMRREHWDGASEYRAYLAVAQGSGALSFKGPSSMRRTSGRGIVEATSPFAWPDSWLSSTGPRSVSRANPATSIREHNLE